MLFRGSPPNSQGLPNLAFSIPVLNLEVTAVQMLFYSHWLFRITQSMFQEAWGTSRLQEKPAGAERRWALLGTHCTWCENLKGDNDCACHLLSYWTIKENGTRILACPKIRNFGVPFKPDHQTVTQSVKQNTTEELCFFRRATCSKITLGCSQNRMLPEVPGSQANIHI